MQADPSHPHARRWKAGLSKFSRDITHHIRVFFEIYRTFLEIPLTVLDFGRAGVSPLGSLLDNPRRDISCSRLGWVIEQELLFYFWHKQRWDRNACIQYTHLHREHRYHPWVQETLFRWADSGDARRVLQLLGLRALQSKNLNRTIEDSLWRLLVLEAVGELVERGMSVRQATDTLAGKLPEKWPISSRLLETAHSWRTVLGRDIVRAVGQKALESLCYPRPTEESWRAFCVVHHVYRGHLMVGNNLPPFPTSFPCWNHLLWRCQHLYELPIIRPPEPFDLTNLH